MKYASARLTFTSVIARRKENGRCYQCFTAQTYSESLSNREVVLPSIVLSANFFVVFSGGLSFPSINSTAHMISLSQQHTKYYSSPSGHSLRGVNICPGQAYLFVHGDVDLSRQFNHPGPKKFLFHTLIKSRM